MSATSAGVLILRASDGRVLMVRRSPGLSYPGHWGVPGGRREAGEVPRETAVREAMEELGGIPPLEIVDEYWHAENPFFQFATYLAMVAAGYEAWEPVLNPENDAWGWFGLGVLPDPLVPGTRRAVRTLVRAGRV